MKQLTVAKSAGFCFGVSRSVKMADDLLAKGGSCWSFGDLIHNADVVHELARKGLRVTTDPKDLGAGDAVIVRSHGITKALYDTLEATGATVVDATCPRVKHIHNIVSEASAQGRQCVIIGAKDHPEVQAICGWCRDPLVAQNAAELQALFDAGTLTADTAVTMVIQTTQTRDKLDECTAVLQRAGCSAQIENTICGATSTRQSEAEALSRSCDAMVVIGAKHSANSRHLNEICCRHCGNVQFIENAQQLDLDALRGAETVGLTAGASVPDWIIREVTDQLAQLCAEA